LSTDTASLHKLTEVVTERLTEGFGETVFEIGFENNGDSMKLTLNEFNAAYKRLVEAAKGAGADCQLLLTKNVGGELEGTTTGRERDASGKVMVRQVPRTVEDVIETRIAVVGNGESCFFCVWCLVFGWCGVSADVVCCTVY
jgi:GTPase